MPEWLSSQDVVTRLVKGSSSQEEHQFTNVKLFIAEAQPASTNLWCLLIILLKLYRGQYQGILIITTV